MKAIIINGGNSLTSRVVGVEQEIGKLFQRANVTFNTINVHLLPAEDLITANYNSPIILDNIKKVEEADIVVLITPVYKGAYSGILKTFLDLLPQKGLQGKVVLPVAVGGSIAHLLSIDYALRPVAAILGATTILPSVYVVDKQVQKVDGAFTVEQDVVERLENSFHTVFEQSKVNS